MLQSPRRSLKSAAPLSASKLFVAAAVLAIAALTVPSQPAESAMSDYRWKKRPLIVFAGNPSDARLSRQRATVSSARSGFSERDMVVIWVVGDTVSTDLGSGPGQSAAALRARYGVGAASFRALLVGKDGGVKISSGDPVATRTLFSTIDAMPMRQDEMRRR